MLVVFFLFNHLCELRSREFLDGVEEGGLLFSEEEATEQHLVVVDGGGFGRRLGYGYLSL